MNGKRHIELLQNLWEQCPELRFGQLLDYIVCKAEEESKNDTFFVSDGTYERILQELVLQHTKK